MAYAGTAQNHSFQFSEGRLCYGLCWVYSTEIHHMSARVKICLETSFMIIRTTSLHCRSLCETIKVHMFCDCKPGSRPLFFLPYRKNEVIFFPVKNKNFQAKTKMQIDCNHLQCVHRLQSSNWVWGLSTWHFFNLTCPFFVLQVSMSFGLSFLW